MKVVMAVGALVMALLALTIIGGSFYTIDQGDRGVLLRNGAVIGKAEPGIGFKLPLIDSVEEISIRDQARMYPEMAVYSRDQQPADLNVSISFRIPENKVEEVYSTYGGVDGILTRLVDRRINEIVRNVFGKYTAVSAVQEREKLVSEIKVIAQSSIDGPITIIGVQVENIDFSAAYEESIEKRMLAEVEVQRTLQEAERERINSTVKVVQAQAEADSRLAIAKAEAESVRLIGDAQAHIIRERGAALRDNPDLIGLVQAEKWNGVLPTTMIPGHTVPFLNVDNLK